MDPDDVKRQRSFDPDECLKQIVELTAEGGAQDFDELAERFMDLDNWLRHGGALPAVWEHPRPTIHQN